VEGADAPSPAGPSATVAPGGGGAPAAPPSRRGALLRSAFIVGILALVFLVILPQSIDYGDVLAAFSELDLGQVALMTALGGAAWFASGLVLAALIEGVAALRGAMSWVILSGIGSSIPFGPWNMGVLWMVVRGWGVTNVAATSGIALYGIANTLSILFLPLLAVAALSIQGGFAISSHPTTAWVLAAVVAGAALLVIALIVGIVRSERIAGWLARTSQRIVTSVVRRLGRSGGPNVEVAIFHFRDQLGAVIRRRGLAGLLLAAAAHLVWVVVLVAAMRAVGVDEATLPWTRILAVYSIVMVVMILPIAPGGAGIPELLFIAMLSSITDGVDRSTIAAGVFLYRVYYWFLPIPLAWIMLKVSRRGRSTLPSAAELREMASGADSA
jgi:uncharacterized membrane protein YbhN (UPF0104 family)